MVLYSLTCRRRPSIAEVEFLLVDKNGSPTFPPTRFRPRQNIYSALVRTMEGDLGLPPETYVLEKEMDMLPSAGSSHTCT